jgi:hypothetical protein
MPRTSAVHTHASASLFTVEGSRQALALDGWPLFAAMRGQRSMHAIYLPSHGHCFLLLLVLAVLALVF